MRLFLTELHTQAARVAFLFIAALPFSVSVHADLIVGVPPAANSVSFGNGGVSDCSAQPTTAVDAGFSVSTDGPACFPYSGGWSFVDNGQWFTLPMIVDTSGSTSITINLGGSYSAVWGFMDYTLACGDDFGPCTTSGNDPTVTALDKDMNVLESYDIVDDLNGSSSGDIDFLAGDTVGITRSASDIAYLRIGGDNLAISNISLSGAAPEPSTMTLFVLTAVALGLCGKMRRKRCAQRSQQARTIRAER